MYVQYFGDTMAPLGISIPYEIVAVRTLPLGGCAVCKYRFDPATQTYVFPENPLAIVRSVAYMTLPEAINAAHSTGLPRWDGIRRGMSPADYLSWLLARSEERNTCSLCGDKMAHGATRCYPCPGPAV